MTTGKTTKVADDLCREAHAKAMFDSLSDVRVFEREVDVGDLWYTTDRIFVSDLPWWERFLIWLFPRMYDIREYNP